MKIEKLFQKAVSSYLKYCQDNAVIYCQPNRSITKIGWKYVHLANCNGKLATYLIKRR